jgi:prevent-host-death family protein
MEEKSVGTRELKNHLSHYLRKVKAGGTVVITERGKPIGQIVPVQTDLTSRMKKLAEAGVLEWNGQAVPAYKPKAKNRSKRLLSDLISEDRE